MGATICKAGVFLVIFVDDFASFLWFILNSSNIFLKLADLCKCKPRLHLNIVFEVSAPRIFMLLPCFSGYSPCSFSLTFFGFRYTFGALGCKKATTMSSKIDAEVGIEKIGSDKA